MSWAAAGQRAKQRDDQRKKSGGRWVKLSDGDQMDFVLLGEPHVRFKRWDQSLGKSVDAGGPGGDAKVFYTFNVWDVGEQSVRVLELNERWFLALYEDHIDEDGSCNIFRIKRKGTGTSTEYKFKTVAGKQDEAQAIVEREGGEDNLHELDGVPVDEVDWGGSSNDSGDSGEFDDDVPF